MSELLPSYLGYLRDCARLSSRRSEVDMLRSTSDYSVIPLSSENIRELKSRDGVFLSNDSNLLKWRRDSRISDESDLVTYLGFSLILGKNGSKRLAAPLFIAPCELIGSEEHELEVLVDFEAVEAFTPIIVELMSKNTESDDFTLRNDIDTFATTVYKHKPNLQIDSRDLKILIKTLEDLIPVNERYKVKDLNQEYSGTDISTLKDLRDSEWSLFQSMWIMKCQPLGYFTVARELDTIISNGDCTETSVSRIMRRVGEGIINDYSTRNEWEKKQENVLLSVDSLSRKQEEAINNALVQDLTVINGPPGTGKSHTIAALVLNLAYQDKTVLVTSKTNEAVRVVSDMLKSKGSDYGVAYLGDKMQDRSDFADLIDGIINREDGLRNLTKLKKTKSETAEKLIEIKDELIKTEREIKRATELLGLIHVSNEELGKLPDIPINQHHLDYKELKEIYTCAKTAKLCIQGVRPSFKQRLKSRALTNRICDTFVIDRSCGLEKAAIIVGRSYHKSSIIKNQNKLRNIRTIKDLWNRQKKLTVELIQQSQDVFEAKRKLSLGVFFAHEPDASAKMKNYLASLRLVGKTKGSARKKRILLNSVSSKLLLQAFPVWAAPTTHLTSFLGLEPNLFDYVVIDEASLCDPATAIPALYRAKRAVIVGDEKQLKHRVILGKERLAAAAVRNKLSDSDHVVLSFEKSLYEIAESRTSLAQVRMLDEHYRSLPQIIGFSNVKWYGGILKNMRKTPINDLKDNCVLFIEVAGGRNIDRVVYEEIKKASDITHELISQKRRQTSQTIGIITMTEEQAKHAKSHFESEFSLKEISDYKIKIGTPQSFQGDERNTIILCPGIEMDGHFRAVSHALDENRFNVAVTRAKNQVIVVSCIPPEFYPGLLREYWEFTQKKIHPGPGIDPDNFDSNFEKQVYQLIHNKGYKVIPQYETCGYRLDFVVVDEKTRYVGIEVDGKQHFDSDGNYIKEDIERELRLRRAGWDIVRISYIDWEKGIEGHTKFLHRIKEALDNRSTFIN
jgi:very-short-patch-repair endonuclease